ncbi:MAG: trigger factor, partial [Firmicutes bacterium]|nr:trigger factor [Bacillota bacterium]
LEELKAASAERLQKYIDAQSISRAKDAIIEKVFEANPVEAPAVMVEDEIDNMIQELDQQLRYQGLSVDQYMQFMQKDAKEFRDELRPDAEKKVSTRLVLMSIVEAEGIEVTEEDLETELKDMASTYNMAVEEVKNAIGAEGMKFFKKDIQLKKVIDLMYEKAVVTKVAPKEEK